MLNNIYMTRELTKLTVFTLLAIITYTEFNSLLLSFILGILGSGLTHLIFQQFQAKI
jgi:hypothetical protein